MTQKHFVVTTTIFDPTPALKKVIELKNFNLVSIGDLKTPKKWNIKGATYFSPSRQKLQKYKIIKLLPWNHYSRKMIGYLYAIEKGADIIIDLDDDNFPYDSWGKIPPKYKVMDQPGAVNIYQYFSNQSVWPRGFPLEQISQKRRLATRALTNKDLQVGIWQYLVDGHADVDAIYRLISNKEVKFKPRNPISLAPNTYCPFDSQNTLFSKELFPLLYLPGFVNFRFTDILRGLVAQPIMWVAGFSLGFTKPNANQVRNAHNFLKDFESEIPVYLFASRVLEISKASVNKRYSVEQNLLLVYENLLKEKIIISKEVTLLKHWISDVESAKTKSL